MILDNFRVHHSKLVKAWAAERQDKIELFYLPIYSPELNPEERLNADLKQLQAQKRRRAPKCTGTHQSSPARTNVQLKAVTMQHMQMLETSPERVMKYFQDSRVKYAA